MKILLSCLYKLILQFESYISPVLNHCSQRNISFVILTASVYKLLFCFIFYFIFFGSKNHLFLQLFLSSASENEQDTHTPVSQNEHNFYVQQKMIFVIFKQIWWMWACGTQIGTYDRTAERSDPWIRQRIPMIKYRIKYVDCWYIHIVSEEWANMIPWRDEVKFSEEYKICSEQEIRGTI